MKISCLLILCSLFAAAPTFASTMSTLCDCLLGTAGVISCKDVESQLTLTRYQLDYSLNKGWIASSDFSSVKNGRPEDVMQAELFNYLVGNRVAILKSDFRGKLSTVSGILDSVDFSNPISSTYFIKNSETGEINGLTISPLEKSSVEGFRVFPPADGELQLLEFFRQDGIREDNLAKDRAIDQVYSDIKWLQAWFGQEDSAAWIKIESRLLRLDSNLISGNVRGVYNDWLETFNEVQKAFTSAKQAELEINRLISARETASDGSRKYDLAIASLQLISDRNADIIGRNFQAVRAAQKKILAITEDPSCTTVCSVNARIVSDVFGLPYLGKTTLSGMPTTAELKEFVRNHPYAKVAQLREERNEQIKAAFQALLLQKPFLNAIETVAKNTPWINQTKAIQLLKIFYDANARTHDFPKITALLRNKSGIDAQIDQLRGYAAADPDVMVSFARRVDTTELWKALKAQAERTNEDLFARMNDAEKRARTMGDLALFNQTNWASVTALAFVFAGGTYLSYEAHKNRDSLFDELEREVSRVPGFGSLKPVAKKQ